MAKLSRNEIEEREERAFLSDTLRLLGSELATDDFIKATPDFVHSKEDLGIEVTKLLPRVNKHGNSLQAVDTHWDRVASDVQQRLNDTSEYPSLIVTLSVDHDQPVATRLISIRTKEICAFIFEYMNRGRQDYECNRLDPELPTGLSNLSFNKIDGEFSMVTKMGTMFTGFLDQSHIQDRIDAKECKIADYRSVTTNIWLLLVFNTFELGAMYRLGDVVDRSFKFTFDCVYLYDVADQNVHRLMSS